MRSRIWTVTFLVMVVCASTAMLGAVYTRTEPRVRRNERIKVQRSILEVFHIPFEENSIEEVFALSVDTQDLVGRSLYRSKDGGVAVEISGAGVWGEMSALIALEHDLETVIGLKILKNVETPGLGGRISEDWFQDQFVGKKAEPELRIVSRGEAKKPNEVDGITGATQTSEAFEKMLNSNIAALRRDMGR